MHRLKKCLEVMNYILWLKKFINAINCTETVHQFMLTQYFDNTTTLSSQ